MQKKKLQLPDTKKLCKPLVFTISTYQQNQNTYGKTINKMNLWF